MDLDQPLRRRARLAVIAVDVLRQHPALRLELLQLRDGFVTGVRLQDGRGSMRASGTYPVFRFGYSVACAQAKAPTGPMASATTTPPERRAR